MSQFRDGGVLVKFMSLTPKDCMKCTLPQIWPSYQNIQTLGVQIDETNLDRVKLITSASSRD